ncbi:MAG: hypothetical protein E7111_08815 [Bacteroidales bacterium]|nr:hypothetical protein [Bacteroidales bacterium]
MKFVYMLAALFTAASVAAAQEPERPKETWEIAAAEADRLQGVLELEDWQVFYVDSTLKHDYAQMKLELEKLQTSKVSNPSLYYAVQDKWMERIDATYMRIFSDVQWKAYLKSGAAKAQKARAKRRAEASGQ